MTARLADLMLDALRWCVDAVAPVLLGKALEHLPLIVSAWMGQ